MIESGGVHIYIYFLHRLILWTYQVYFLSRGGGSSWQAPFTRVPCWTSYRLWWFCSKMGSYTPQG